jgi:hypothetical protein
VCQGRDTGSEHVDRADRVIVAVNPRLEVQETASESGKKRDATTLFRDRIFVGVSHGDANNPESVIAAA